VAHVTNDSDHVQQVLARWGSGGDPWPIVEQETTFIVKTVADERLQNDTGAKNDANGVASVREIITGSVLLVLGILSTFISAIFML
jgi:hypothetical protein